MHQQAVTGMPAVSAGRSYTDSNPRSVTGTARGRGPAPHRALAFLGAHRDAPPPLPVLHRALGRLLAPAAQVEGVDWHLADPALADRAAQARAALLVLPPLGNLSNAHYRVHPRRNDRFIAAHASLRALYPEVDFASVVFTGQLLTLLSSTCPHRFIELRRDLQRDWTERVETLIATLPARGVLIDLPAAPWLARPALAAPGYRRLSLDPDDRTGAAIAIAAALGRMHRR